MQNKLVQEFLVQSVLRFFKDIRLPLGLSQTLKFPFSCFTSGLWCNIVQNQLCYIYVVGKLRCCSPPLLSPQNLCGPYFSNVTDIISFVFFWNFLWQCKLFVFIWSCVQAFSICSFNSLYILISYFIPKLYPVLPV